MNQKTIRWLHSLKIAPGHINEVELKNGYLFGLIFEKLNLMKDKKYKNTHDLACIFQNFKNTKDLLYDHFGIMFSANEIIYRYNQLLQKVCEAGQQYQKNRKQTKLGQIKKKYMTINNNTQINTVSGNEQKLLSLRQKQLTLNNNTMNKTFSSQQPKLPPKILEIQKKLSKYKQQKTRHELLNLQLRKQQLDETNQAIQDHRYFQISKTKMNQEMRKQLQKRVAEVVAKTDEEKQKRIMKDESFFRFMKSKKDNIQSQKKLNEQKGFTQGMQDFQLNCLRQGIELQHDPNKRYEQKDDNFNSKVMLQRIKDNIKNLERQRKQRHKRANSKYVQTEETNLKSQKIWEENNFLEKLQKNLSKHQQYLNQAFVQINFQKASKQQIQLKLSKKVTKTLPQATIQQREKFEGEIRANRLIYYDKQIERLQKKEKYLKSIAEEALEALINTTIIAEQQQKNLNFTYSQWKKIQRSFIDYQHVPDEKRKKDVLEIEKKPSKDSFHFIKYLEELKEVKKQRKLNPESQQKQLASFIDRLIQISHPKKSIPQPTILPLYMPLRIALTGSSLSGKTSQIKKLLAKYNNLVLIDPKKIITQAIQLAKPPLLNQDPKKKKDPKKVQEQTPEKLQLKKFGQQILAQIKKQTSVQDPLVQYDSIDFKYVIKAIKFKLRSFPSLSTSQQLQKYNKCHQDQLQRIKDFQKNQEEKNKKKDSKKGAQTQVIQQLPTFNEFFYTEGFVIDNLNLDDQKMRLIQRDLNGFVKVQERLNEEAENLRQEFGRILPINKSEVSTDLNKGFLNIIIDLNASNANQQQRNQGRKIDPQTGQIYHPKSNPVPTDVKGLAQRLIQVKKTNIQSRQQQQTNRQKRKDYYKAFGYENKKQGAYKCISQLSMQETYLQITKIVENTLKIQYQIITNYQEKQKQKQVNVIVDKSTKQQESKEDVDLQKSNNEKGDEQFTQIFSNHFELLPIQSAYTLINKLKSFNFSYQQSLSQILSSFDVLRYKFQQSLLEEQKLFLQIITRPDDKANRILTFQDNFNKLLEEKANVINDKNAINHLVTKLDELYDSLWINIEGKKNEAIAKRKQILANGWINSQVQKMVQLGKDILQSELNYLVDILSFILIGQLQFEGKNTEPVIDYLCLGIPKQIQPIESVIPPSSEQKVSPRLQYYINQAQNCLSTINEWFSKKQQQSKIKLSDQFEKLSFAFIEKQKQKMGLVIQYLKEEIYSYIEQEFCYFQALVNKMDDWIIFGIKQENQFTYSIYKELKMSIQKLNRSQLKDLFPEPITSFIKPIQHMSRIHQPLPFQNTQKKVFDYSSFKVFLEELKSFSSISLNSSNTQIPKINFSRFVQYFNKRKKSKLLSDLYLKIDYDTMQQFLVQDKESNYRQRSLVQTKQANFRQVAFSMLLWDITVLQQEELNAYIFELTNNTNLQETSFISEPQQMKIDHLIPLKLSRRQKKCLQNLIFNIMQNEYTYKVNLRQFVETLRVFNSLQLFKYGDSLMMLNQQKKK